VFDRKSGIQGNIGLLTLKKQGSPNAPR
jgi:hypothetical protein